MTTFECYYKDRYPDLDPEKDDFYEQLKECWETAYSDGVMDMFIKVMKGSD
jgi:hypothetical protein